MNENSKGIKDLKRISYILVVLFFGLSSIGSAQDCINLTSLISTPIADFNNDNITPGGTVLTQTGDLKFVKSNNTTAGVTNSDPTTVNSVTSNKIQYQGAMTFDMSSALSACKKLYTTISAGDSIYVDETPFSMTGMMNTDFPYQLNDSVIIEIAGSDWLFKGKFEKIKYSNGFNGTEMYTACYEACSDMEDCKTDFSFSIGDLGKVDFVNQSSLDPANADSFQWDLGNGNTDSDENPSHTFEEGVYNVCLSIDDSECFLDPAMKTCKEIEVKHFPDCKVGEFKITPNEDGDSDFIGLKAGSKVYDRFGALVANIVEDSTWKGTNQNGNNLPTGNYTVLCGNGGTFNVTVIR